MKNTKISFEQAEKFRQFILGDDLDFYEEFVINLTNEEQVEFFRENPGFMSEFPVSHDKMYLLRDESFRNILRKIKRFEEGENYGNLSILREKNGDF